MASAIADELEDLFGSTAGEFEAAAAAEAGRQHGGGDMRTAGTRAHGGMSAAQRNAAKDFASILATASQGRVVRGEDFLRLLSTFVSRNAMELREGDLRLSLNSPCLSYLSACVHQHRLLDGGKPRASANPATEGSSIGGDKASSSRSTIAPGHIPSGDTVAQCSGCRNCKAWTTPDGKRTARSLEAHDSYS